MKELKKSLYEAATKVWSKAIISENKYTKDLELKLEIHNTLLNIFQIGKHYYMIFNISKMELELISVCKKTLYPL